MSLKKVINFLRWRYLAFGFSTVLLVLFIAATVTRGGMNLGIDFVGGVKVVAQFNDPVSEGDIRNAFTDLTVQVQQIGDIEQNQFVISTRLTSNEEKAEDIQNLKDTLFEKYPETVFLSEETVGPIVGDILKRSAIKLFLVALVLMTIYLAFRFEFKYAFGAMFSLVHDVVLSFCFIGFCGIEVNIPIIAALLTIFGYTINDTIVVFDRIRENTHTQSKQTFFDVINKSITQTMSRTLLTLITTLFVVLVLYFFGGDTLSDFALVLIFGIITGTYSSIYIAAPSILIWEKISDKKKK